jgi:hypothetical protein
MYKGNEEMGIRKMVTGQGNVLKYKGNENRHAEMKKMTAAMYCFTGGTSGCSCAARFAY